MALVKRGFWHATTRPYPMPPGTLCNQEGRIRGCSSQGLISIPKLGPSDVSAETFRRLVVKTANTKAENFKRSSVNEVERIGKKVTETSNSRGSGVIKINPGKLKTSKFKGVIANEVDKSFLCNELKKGISDFGFYIMPGFIEDKPDLREYLYSIIKKQLKPDVFLGKTFVFRNKKRTMLVEILLGKDLSSTVGLCTRGRIGTFSMPRWSTGKKFMRGIAECDYLAIREKWCSRIRRDFLLCKHLLMS